MQIFYGNELLAPRPTPNQCQLSVTAYLVHLETVSCLGYEGTHLTCTLSHYGLLCCNGESPTFRRNISLPTPGSKSKVSKKPAEAGGKLIFFFFWQNETLLAELPIRELPVYWVLSGSVRKQSCTNPTERFTVLCRKRASLGVCY
jgi:hypothetical protein